MKIKEFITTKVFGFKTEEETRKMTLKQLKVELAKMEKRYERVQHLFEITLAIFFTFEIGSMIANIIIGRYGNAMFSASTAMWIALLLYSDHRAFKRAKRDSQEIKDWQEIALKEAALSAAAVKELLKIRRMVTQKPKRGRGRPRKTILN